MNDGRAVVSVCRCGQRLVRTYDPQWHAVTLHHGDGEAVRTFTGRELVEGTRPGRQFAVIDVWLATIHRYEGIALPEEVDL